MTQPPGKALATHEIAGKHIQHWSSDFGAVLPSHLAPKQFVRLSVGLLRKRKDLADAAAKNPASLFHALMECSRLGHEPGTEQFALTVFNVAEKDANGKKTGRYIPEITGLEQYQGKIERMYRASIPGIFGVQAIHADVVRANDLYVSARDSENGRPQHVKGHFTEASAGDRRHATFMGATQRGELVGVYAYAELAGGAVSKVIEMGREEVMKHKAAAKSDRFWTGDWEEAMWIKTAVHALETWVPTSSEYRREVAAERATDHGDARSAAPADGGDQPSGTPIADGIVDAEVVT